MSGLSRVVGTVLVAAALAALVASGAPAQQRTPVGVQFVVKEATYLPNFDSNEVELLQEMVGRMLADTLRERFPFLRFLSSDTTAHGLSFELNRRDRTSSGPFAEVGFHVALEGPELGREELYWTIFRPEEASDDRLGSVQEFGREIALRVSAADYSELFRSLLSKVPIGDRAEIIDEPLGWLIPYKRSDICVDPESVLLIVNAVPTAVGVSHPKLRAKASIDYQPPGQVAPHLERLRDHIFSEAILDQADIDKLMRALGSGAVQVEAIYVVDFRYSHTACDEIEDPNAAFSGGS